MQHIEQQSIIFKLPDPTAPEIIKRAFAAAKNTINKALDATENAIYKLDVSLFIAFLIAWLLRVLFLQFISSLNILVLLATRKPLDTFGLGGDRIIELSDIHDAIHIDK
ncbi:hypothetical protein MMC07_006000 [Pseudocyphellaria aurata]|nr:hypothetical protein [Pseudocyphellaria aurata]